MKITQEMLDAERERIAHQAFDEADGGAAQAAAVAGWDACLAFLRAHGVLMENVVGTNPDGVIWGEPFVTVQIPREVKR